MSVTLPESVDAWRMVAARRSFQGSLPVASLSRLCEALADTTGEVTYTLDFVRDELGVDGIELHASAPLVLECQRSLQPFTLPLTVDARLGLIRTERDEAALPEGCEPLLVGADDRISPRDVIEDELLLALPLVPIDPDSRLPEELTSVPALDAAAEKTENPFAILRELKKPSGTD